MSLWALKEAVTLIALQATGIYVKHGGSRLKFYIEISYYPVTRHGFSDRSVSCVVYDLVWYHGKGTDRAVLTLFDKPWGAWFLWNGLLVSGGWFLSWFMWATRLGSTKCAPSGNGHLRWIVKRGACVYWRIQMGSGRWLWCVLNGLPIEYTFVGYGMKTFSKTALWAGDFCVVFELGVGSRRRHVYLRLNALIAQKN